ncbi:bifunctional 5,10-methylenetetrahydrofolate dehydrogenase/5,10-methenyltetrahydrofolate cyclohydrolase [Thalassobaculum salexigens]|uniref:bifunctional 5,10-methylenetetrahydrofolate dehydrogenase/5,10-methenyltetrahydrofolate cyclohydrolase n=1 Tax=Thalassobaculum salexigens TaxID=455360 RepID=UPI00248DD238|nr:bifunctional 5,10-methylenetetrahydrofolate dehydrogenase/5,10-methenyltetrahydrofolate cyclohydrolase [Thalassobaculum salexigens]
MKIEAKDIVDAIKAEVTAGVEAHKARGVEPTIRVIVATDDAAVLSYVRSKVKQAGNLGIAMEVVEFGPDKDQAAFEALIRASNDDASIHGVMVELPVRDGLDHDRVLSILDPKKDVDGLTTLNQGLIQQGREAEAICPATPQACIRLAETVGGLSGERVAVVGRGPTVGKPLAAMLINRSATVTVAHSRTTDLAATIAPCRFVFAATGRPGLLNAGNVTADHVILDAGIAYKDDKLVGDFDAEAAEGVAAYTPVPGGVGRVTSAIIFANLLKCMRLQGHP